MSPVLVGRLYRSARPGYSGGGKIPVGTADVQHWIQTAKSHGIASIICLLAEEHLRLYPRPGLLETYSAEGFTVTHIPVNDHRHPPLNDGQLEAVLQAWRSLPQPVLIHCSAGIDRTGAAVKHILAHPEKNDR